ITSCGAPAASSRSRAAFCRYCRALVCASGSVALPGRQKIYSVAIFSQFNHQSIVLRTGCVRIPGEVARLKASLLALPSWLLPVELTDAAPEEQLFTSPCDRSADDLEGMTRPRFPAGRRQCGRGPPAANRQLDYYYFIATLPLVES